MTEQEAEVFQERVVADCRGGSPRCHECLYSSCPDNENPLMLWAQGHEQAMDDVVARLIRDREQVNAARIKAEEALIVCEQELAAKKLALNVAEARAKAVEDDVASHPHHEACPHCWEKFRRAWDRAVEAEARLAELKVVTSDA